MVAAVRIDESRLQGLGRDRRELDQLEAEWLFRVGEYVRSHEWQTDGHAMTPCGRDRQAVPHDRRHGPRRGAARGTAP